ncbi:hypothetical protein ABEV17_11615 [Anoxybacillus kestanbolensis]
MVGSRPPKTSADVRPSCHVSLFGAVNIHDGETVLHQTTAASNDRCQCRDVLGFLANAQRARSGPSHGLGVG